MQEQKEFICIICPKGCHLTVDFEEKGENNAFTVTGYSCPRGLRYAQKELTNPTRTITSTVRITGGLHRRLPVKTDGEIPKDLIFQAMELLDSLEVAAPVKVGEVIVPHILGTDVNFVAAKTM